MWGAGIYTTDRTAPTYTDHLFTAAKHVRMPTRASRQNNNTSDVIEALPPWRHGTPSLIGRAPPLAIHETRAGIQHGGAHEQQDASIEDILSSTFQSLTDEITAAAPWNVKYIGAQTSQHSPSTRTGPPRPINTTHNKVLENHRSQPHDAAVPSHITATTHEGMHIDFAAIRKVCESNDMSSEIDMSPSAFAAHRIKHWPDMRGEECQGWEEIYKRVKATGVPNAMAARIPLPTSLNIPAWEKYLQDSDDERELLDYVKYGFPMGYMGPVSNTSGIDNHPSAKNYKSNVDSFIKKELSHGCLIGPCDRPPFEQWMHISPIMTRDKRDSVDRRIIIDMTYPRKSSVNAYIMKNTVCGQLRQHSLPTVDLLVEDILSMGKGCFLSTADVSRAYKNFSSDALDWPLLGMEWRGKYYCDTTLPFGARASSSCMQRIAMTIVRILKSEGITAHMYLDDLIVVSPDSMKAEQDYKRAKALLSELGLPEAKEKAQPPARLVTWLGIDINTKDMSIAVPPKKLRETLDQVGWVVKRRSITKKTLQSMLGRLLHVAKCVRPARLFVSKLLEALRNMKHFYINVNSEMRSDLKWFLNFGKDWNGVALIPRQKVDVDLFVDACLSGIGASNGTHAYWHQVCPVQDPVDCISELEAANIAVALHTFMNEDHRGMHVRVHCDNEGAVSVLTTGRGRNKVILDVARKAWLIQAKLDLFISYVHIPGVENQTADILSRAHLSDKHLNEAHELVVSKCLLPVKPHTVIFDQFSPKISCRSGHQLSAGPGHSKAVQGKGTGHSKERESGRKHLPSIHVVGKEGPLLTTPQPHMHIPGVSVQSHKSPRDYQKLPLPSQGTRVTGHRPDVPSHSPQDNPGHGGNKQEQVLHTESKSSSSNGRVKTNCHTPTGNPTLQRSQSSIITPILCSSKTRGGYSTKQEEVPRYLPPHKRRHEVCGHGHSSDHKVWKNNAEDWRVKDGSASTIRQPGDLCSTCHEADVHGHANHLSERPTVHVQRLEGSRPHDRNQKALGEGPHRPRSPQQTVHPPRPKNSSSHAGIPWRNVRVGSPALWRLEVRRP